MKTISTLALVLVSLFTTSCGTGESTSDLASRPSSSSLKRHAFALEGHIKSVDTQFAKAPATGMWTEVTLAYQLPCAASMESFSYRLNELSNSTEILASAVASVVEDPDTECKRITVVERKVPLPGIYAAANIDLINLRSASDHVAVPDTTVAFSTDVPLEIVSVKTLCPNGEKCVLNGTEVTVLAHLGCVDTLGPVSFASIQNSENKNHKKINLAISAVNLVNKNSATTRCFAENTQTTKFTLVSQFVDASDINLLIVK